jgi:tagatose-6-phosphate ketose/aldose isomerase
MLSKYYIFVTKGNTSIQKGIAMNNNLLLKEIKDNYSGGDFTSKEILGQPNLWLKVWEYVKSMAPEISIFLNKAKSNTKMHIILTGAGTSAFIGEILEGPFQRGTGLITKAVATTDLVTHPELYFQNDKEVLLISFARSGNSPESTKAIQLAEQLSHKILNIVITCNENGNLVKNLKNSDNLIFFLPPEADDKSLAMTSSFTSMLLAGLLISDINSIDDKKSEVSTLNLYGKKIFSEYLSSLLAVSELDFDRAVFLGSGPMKGVARESHLKLQELTDGKIVCTYDSFLGLRHGPKAVINEHSLLTYLFSNNRYVNKYEVDFVNDISNGRKPIFSIGIMESKIEGIHLDLEIILGDGESKLSEDFLAIVSVLPAQILGFFKSFQSGLKPDNPSVSGMINRVVQGVNIYPYDGENNIK